MSVCAGNEREAEKTQVTNQLAVWRRFKSSSCSFSSPHPGGLRRREAHFPHLVPIFKLTSIHLGNVERWRCSTIHFKYIESTVLRVLCVFNAVFILNEARLQVFSRLQKNEQIFDILTLKNFIQ